MKNIISISIGVLCAAILILSSCRNRNDSENKNSARIHPHFIDSVMNGSYYNSTYGEYFRFHNGTYAIDTTVVENGDTIRTVLSISIGSIVIEHDFDHDGETDALVSMHENGGGSGTFVSVAVMLGGNNTAAFADSKFLGDRIKIDSAAMAGDTVVVFSLIQGPQDPLCCPTMPYIFKLMFRNKVLDVLNEPA